MASISKSKDGKRRILFKAPDGQRKTIYLGKTPLREARSIKVKVEALAAAAIAKVPWDTELATWLNGISDVLYDKLVAKDLVPPREREEEPDQATLGGFLEQYIAGRTDVAESTVDHFNRVKRDLVACFGSEKRLRAITVGDANDFRRHLLSRLSDNTARRMCGRAKQFFEAAVDKELIPKNPFWKMKGKTKGCSVQANRSRDHFIPRDEAQRVIEACPDAQWRLLFALSRYGGLRCPSEHLVLRWQDVDWEHSRIAIHSPKTGLRIIPLFPELQPYLEQVFDEAEPGTEYVITRYRQRNANLRTQLMRIIKRAGLEPWPKLFQNLRATRETELAQDYPIHVACKWIGNSQAVAAKHYLQVTEDHFKQAVADDAEYDAPTEQEATQNPTQTVSDASRQHETGERNVKEDTLLCPIVTQVIQGPQAPQATPPGLEPGMTEPKSVVLPLHQGVRLPDRITYAFSARLATGNSDDSHRALMRFDRRGPAIQKSVEKPPFSPRTENGMPSRHAVVVRSKVAGHTSLAGGPATTRCNNRRD